PAYGYEDFVEGLRPRPTDAGLTFEPAAGLFRRICAVATAHPDESVVLVIDEFNRGDVARIFGELLTLLELDKRQRIHVVLPYSGDAFTVPRNVRILATMNTSDRSIALLDAALQRRLGKVELLPDPKVLGSAAVEGISLAGLLTAINRRLLEVLGDRARDLQVGHAYFMIDGKRLNTFSALRDVVQYDLLPLLQDYCADDPRSLHQLVGDALYDPGQRRFRTTPFAEGEGDRLAEALLGWGDEVAAEVPDSSSEDTDDSDDDA
ncbi:MAG TPA: AAA family ATPase, partial [Deltaproteobacteria bacterium]|nr:AAA family ATPase [Deltaproteobacteria bacterium]